MGSIEKLTIQTKPLDCDGVQIMPNMIIELSVSEQNNNIMVRKLVNDKLVDVYFISYSALGAIWTMAQSFRKEDKVDIH